MGALMQIKDAMAFAFAPPPIPELGIAGGFDFFLKDNAGLGHDALVAARNQFLGMAAQSKLLANVRPTARRTRRSSTSTSTCSGRRRSGCR